MGDNEKEKILEDSLTKLTEAFLNPVGNQLPLMSDVAINLPEPIASMEMINALADALRIRIGENMRLARLILESKLDPGNIVKANKVKNFKRKKLPVLSNVWVEKYLHLRKGVHGEGRQASVDLIKENMATRPLEDEGKSLFEVGKKQ